MDRGEEKVGDESVTAALRRDALRIHGWALAGAAILVLIAFLVAGSN